ncbi:OprD family outer membrane porin [Parendozoicomonas haliclonae]|uniref:Outer membrane porin, OprD family n=1 Tax=Parendozoicomonas haliclonae TaxID=1960125 RepID=A0A1X7AH80_9GAMM|nr:OprD family outer membrane porin [Parendozoicomonas haliclonae]SMA40482.1 outer membrane porin, OprD family [Parendozoicomonas haliclonae]
MNFQKAAIALSIGASCFILSAQASPFAPEAKKELNLIDMETGYSFFDDASVDAKFRFVGYSRDSYRSGQTGHPDKAFYRQLQRRDSALSLWTNFESGWLWDSVGFDLGAYTTKVLESRGHDFMPKMWANNDVKSASKIGVANLKFRFGNEEMGMDGRVGRMTLNLPMVISEMDTALPETYEGIQLNGHYKMVSGYVAHMDSFSSEMSSSTDKLMPYGIETDAPIKFAGMTFGKQGETPVVGIHYGEQKDYLKKTMYTVEAGMPVGDNFVAAKLLYQDQEGGKYYRDGNHKADMVALNLMAQIGQDLTLLGGYSQVGDEPYDVYFSDGIYAMNNNTNMIWNDFTHGNMKAVSLGGIYSLASLGIEGLSVNTMAAYGWDADMMTFGETFNMYMPLTDDSAWEVAAGVTYEIFQGPMQGLWLHASYNRDGGGFGNHQGGRIIFDYTVKLF